MEEVYLYFSSLPQNLVLEDGKEWYNSHSHRIIELVDTMNRNSSNIVIDSIERVNVKLTLHDNNLSRLPSKHRRVFPTPSSADVSNL